MSAIRGGVGLVLMGAFVLLAYAIENDDDGGGGPGVRGPMTARVIAVIDGDTIEVAIRGTPVDVRYIGVDTPETVAPGEPVECFGRRAGELNRRLVERRRVRLVFDRERHDAYGRLLAYVYSGGRFINAELVRRGAARTLEIAPNLTHAGAFARLEMAAARAGHGLWGACRA